MLPIGKMAPSKTDCWQDWVQVIAVTVTSCDWPYSGQWLRLRISIISLVCVPSFINFRGLLKKLWQMANVKCLGQLCDHSNRIFRGPVFVISQEWPWICPGKYVRVWCVTCLPNKVWDLWCHCYTTTAKMALGFIPRDAKDFGLGILEFSFWSPWKGLQLDPYDAWLFLLAIFMLKMQRLSSYLEGTYIQNQLVW